MWREKLVTFGAGSELDLADRAESELDGQTIARQQSCSDLTQAYTSIAFIETCYLTVEKPN